MGIIILVGVLLTFGLAMLVLLHWSYVPLRALQASEKVYNATIWEC